jgi:hypothetical protein
MIISGFPSTFQSRGKDGKSRSTKKRTVKRTRRSQRTSCPTPGPGGQP